MIDWHGVSRRGRMVGCWGLIAAALSAATCFGDDSDQWLGQWFIRHEAHGVPRVVRMVVQRSGDELSATLRSNTGTASVDHVLTDGEQFSLTYPWDIVGTTAHIELRLRRDSSTESVPGSVLVRYGNSSSQFLVEAVRAEAGAGGPEKESVSEQAISDRDPNGRSKTAISPAYQGRWLLTLDNANNPAKPIKMGMIVAGKSDSAVVGLSGMNLQGRRQIIDAVSEVENGYRWPYDGGIFGPLNMHVRVENDSLSVVIANALGAIFLRGTAVRVSDDVAIGIDSQHLQTPSLTLLGTVGEFRKVSVQDSLLLLQSKQTVRAIATEDPFLFWIDVLQLPPACQLIDWQSDSIWVRSGSAIQRRRTSTDDKTELVSSCTLPGNAPSLVRTFGNRAYAANWNGDVNGRQVHVVDLKGPDAPRLISSFTTSKGSTNYDLCVAGDHLFVANATGLLIIDLHDAAHPQLLSTFDARGRYVRGVDGSASQLFVATSYHADSSWIQGIETTNLVSPKQSMILRTDGGAQDVTMDGALLYVADRQNGVLVVDIADPGHPTLAARFKTPQNANEVDVSGSVVLVSQTGMMQMFLRK